MRAKKLILLFSVILLVLAGLVLPGAGASAGPDKTCYLLHPGMTFSASNCDEYVWVLGWGATTPGLINLFLDENPFSVAFAGPGGFTKMYSRAELAGFWGPAYPLSPAEAGWDCPMPQLWFTDLNAPIGADLAPGTYTFTIFVIFDHPFTDGFTACKWEGGPLGRNIYQGSGQFSGTFTVIP